jgi:hypothetical protein
MCFSFLAQSKELVCEKTDIFASLMFQLMVSLYVPWNECPINLNPLGLKG